MLDRLFTEHPNAVGETYLAHMESAWSFGLRMIAAGLACLVHGLFPFLFLKTGSTAIRALHNEMLMSRARGEVAKEAEIGAYI